MFNKLNSEGKDVGVVLSHIDNIGNKNLSKMFSDLAAQGKNAKASLEECYAVILNGNTKGAKNVANIIKTYNDLGNKTGKTTQAQKEFSAAVGQSNAQLGNYLGSVQSGQAAYSGYASKVALATVKTIGLRVATTALNMALSMGISLLVQGAISAISYIIHYEENLLKEQEELRESAKKLTEQYKTAKEEADKLNKSSGDLITRYAKLAQGVDALGNNISLTNEEYEEYKNLCNQIADDVPNLIKAYDDEGNAILTLRDNVDALKTAYQEAAKEKYSALLDSEDIENALKAYSEFVKKYQQIDISGMGVGANTITVSKVGLNGMSNLDAMKVFEQLLKEHSIANISLSNEELQKLFNDFNIDYDWGSSHSNAQESKMYQDVSTALAKLKLEYSIYQSSLDSLSNAILNIYDGFYDLPSELQTIANAAANNLPDSLIESLTGNVDNDKTKIANYIYSVVDSLNNPKTAEQVTKAYKQIFSITKEDLPVKETLSQVQGYVDEIVKATGMDEGSIRKIFGLDEIDNISQQLDNIKQRFIDAFSFGNEEIRGNFFEGLLNELSDADIPNTTDEIKALAEAVDEVSQAGGKSTDVLDVYRKKISSLSNFDSEKYDITETTKQLQEAYSALIEFRRTLSDDTKTTEDVEKSVRAMAKLYENNAEVKVAAEEYFTTHSKESALKFQEVYKDAYLTDQNNFNAWLEEKKNVAKANENDKDAWDKFAASEFVDVFKDAYGIDLANYTSYLDMKSKLTQKWLDDNGYDIAKIPVTSAVNQILQAAEDALNLDEIAAMYGSFFDSYTPFVPEETTKSSSSKNDDPIKDAFQKKEKELQHLVSMGQKTEEQYWQDLFSSEEYKNLLSDRVKYQDELNSIDEKYYTFRQNRHKKNAEEELKIAQDEYKRGIIDAEQYAKRIEEIGQKYYGEGSEFAGTEYATEGLKDTLDKADDLISDIYNSDLSELKKNNDGTLKAEEQFIDDWIALNDEKWKATNPKEWEENYSEIADYTQKFYKRLLDNGTLDVDQYESKVKEFFNKLKDLGIDLGKSWLAEALDVDGISYDKFKEELAKDGDRTLENVLADAEELEKKNIKLFSDDPNELKSNAKDIFNSVKDAAKDALDKMLISPEQYLDIIDKWGKRLEQTSGVIEEAKDAVSESDYLDRWDLDNGYDSKKSKDDFKLRANRIKHIYELAEQMYGKDGQDNVKAYNALINQGLEDVESLVEDYYDKEIEKLEKINDEEEKREKALELQLNLIKARQKLEDAKKQKNQLIFENGTFRYDYDQEAVMSAQDDVAEAEKAILEAQREEQKEILEAQKQEASDFFTGVNGKLDDLIGRLTRFLNGDTDAFKVDADTTTTDTTDVADATVETKDEVADVVTETANISSAISSLIGVANIGFETLVNALGGKWTKQGEENFKSGFIATSLGKKEPDNVSGSGTNNSTTNNNATKVINVGGITVKLELAVQSLDDFVENKIGEAMTKFGNAIEQEMPKVLAKA